MANYGVDIEVALKGVEKLRQFEKTIGRTISEVEKLTKALKEVKQQNPYDVTGARRVTQFEKERLKVVKAQNDALAQQKRLVEDRLSKESRANLKAQAEARRAAGRAVQMRPIAGVAYPQGAAPGGAREMAPGGLTLISPQARASQEAAAIEKVSRLRRKENEIKKATRFLEIDLINKQISLEVDGIEKIGAKQKARFDEDLKAFDKKLALRKEEKRLALQITKIEADLANAKKREDKRVAAEQQRQLKREQAIADARKKQAQQQRKTAFSSALIGGAFPLLFGQGVGAAAGGALGGGLGGLAGGQLGFGLSLVGTQLGSLFDQLAAKAVDLGKALNPLTADIGGLVTAAGLAGTETGRLIQGLESAGQRTQALNEATRQMAFVVGMDGVKALENFATGTQNLSSQWSILMAQMSAALAALLQGPVAALVGQIETTAAINIARRSSDPELQRLSGQLNRAPTPLYLGGTAFGTEEREKIQKQIVERIRQMRKESAANLANTSQASMVDQARLALAEQQLAALRAGTDLTRDSVFNAQKELLAAEHRLEIEQAKAKTYATNEQSNAAFEALYKEQTADRLRLDQDRAKAFEQQNTKLEQAGEKTKRQLEFAKNLELTLDQQVRILTTASGEAERRLGIQIDFENRAREIAKVEDESFRKDLEKQNVRIQELELLRLETDELFKQAGLSREITDALGQRMNRAQDAISGFAIEGKLLDTQKEKLDEVLKKYPLIGQAAQEAGNLATFGAMQMIDGAQTAEQVFANFLRSIADLLMKSAAQMITTYIAIGVARMFAGVPSAVQSAGAQYGPAAFGGGGVEVKQAFGLPRLAGFGARANGGAVSANTPYLVGERGPELFVPGAQGNIVPNHGMGGSNIVVNVDATGTQVQGDQPNANKLGEALGAAVRAELIRQKRPGGLLA